MGIELDRINGKDSLNLDDLMNDIDMWLDRVGTFQRNAAEQNNVQVRTKGHDTDFVTDVDIRSEEILIDCILQKYPDHSILTEERGMLEGASGFLWVIDPLDGTTNFIHGFPLSSISVALQYKGITQAGMVYSPWLNMKFHAIRGRGAFLNRKRLQVSQTSELKHSLLATGFPNDRSRHNINLDYFNKMTGLVSGIRRTGSAALDLCFVAASFLDGYWEFELNDWDKCAGVLIAEEAGGQVLLMDENNHSLLICANSQIIHLLQDCLLRQTEL